MTTREIRWVEGFKDKSQPIHWNQRKRVHIPEREEPFNRDTDRVISYERQVRNPDFVPTEKRTQGQKYPRHQTVEFITQRKHDEENENAIQEQVETLIAVIQKIADGDVKRFFYSAEAQELKYTQELQVEGETVTEEKSTTDETILEAAQAFVEYFAKAIASEDKPLGVAEPPRNE